MAAPSAEQLNALFDSAGFFILHGLDKADGAEFGIDASPVWTVKKGGFEVGKPKQPIHYMYSLHYMALQAGEVTLGSPNEILHTRHRTLPSVSSS